MDLESGAAVEAMRKGRWQEARELWLVCLGHAQALSAHDYNACARVHERLADWDMHRSVVHQGLQLFPHDPALRRRELLGQALDCLMQKELDKAETFLESAGQIAVVSDWSCAFSYWNSHVLLARRLVGISDRLERLMVISDSALYREGHLMPHRIVGLLEAIGCMAWREADRKIFAERLEPLVTAISSYDTALSDIGEDRELEEEITSFAHFCQGRMTHLAELPAGHCEFLARLFIGYGHVELYLYLRQAFVRKIEGLTHADNILPLVYQVAQANESGDYQAYTRLRALKGEMGWTSLGRRKIDHYFRLSALYYAQESDALPFPAIDEDFHRYVSGKRVAIVGPVDVGLDSGAEIDGFDIVVRFNHRHGIGYEPRRFGKRTDLSWYVRPILETESPAWGMLDGMANLEYAITSKNSWSHCKWLELVPCRRRESLHCMSYLGNPMMIGYPHAVQRTLLDLLRFRPEYVKIFSSDMYTGMAYRKEYMRDLSLGTKGGNALSFFSLHDPVSNFLFMQRLVLTKRIDVDEVLARVLTMTVLEYMKQVRLCHVG